MEPALLPDKRTDLVFTFKKRRYHRKNSYERLAFESVDDRSLSYAISQSLTGKGFIL